MLFHRSIIIQPFTLKTKCIFNKPSNFAKEWTCFFPLSVKKMFHTRTLFLGSNAGFCNNLASPKLKYFFLTGTLEKNIGPCKSHNIISKRSIRLHSRPKKNEPNINIEPNFNSRNLAYFPSLTTLCGLGASALLMYTFPGLFAFIFIGGLGYGSFKALRIFSSINKVLKDSNNAFKNNIESNIGESFLKNSSSQAKNVSFQPGFFGTVLALFQPIIKNILYNTQNSLIASEKLQEVSVKIIQAHISNKTQTGQILISEFGPSIESSLQFQGIHMSSTSTVNNGSTSLSIIFTGHIYGRPLFDVQAKGYILESKAGDPKVELQRIQLSILDSHRLLHIPSQIDTNNSSFGRVKEAEYREV